MFGASCSQARALPGAQSIILPTHPSRPGPGRVPSEFQLSETEQNSLKNPPPHRADRTMGRSKRHLQLRRSEGRWLDWCLRQDQTAKSKGSCWHRSAGSASSRPVALSLIASSPPCYPVNPLNRRPLPGSGSPTATPKSSVLQLPLRLARFPTQRSCCLEARSLPRAGVLSQGC